MFSGTIQENIDPMGEHSAKDIWDVLEKVNLKKKFSVSGTEGLNTMIDQGGENLSFGERQLICMARAFLKKTKIVIMDEATSNMDIETEHLLEKSMRECFKNSTVLTIAHRVNTITSSDR